MYAARPLSMLNFRCNKLEVRKKVTGIRIYIHTGARTHMIAYIETHIHTCIHTYIHAYIQTDRQAHGRLRARTHASFVHVYMYKSILMHTCMYIQTDIRIGACARTHTHARPHALQNYKHHI